MIRTTLAKLALSAAVALGWPTWSMAQHHGGGGHGGGGHSGGGHGGHGGGEHGGGGAWHGGGGTWHGGGGTWHGGSGEWHGGDWNHAGSRFFFGFGFPYYGYGYSPWWYRYPGYYDYGYNYDYVPGYYNYQSAYPVPEANYEMPPAEDATRVTAVVRVPTPDAQLLVEGQEMNSGGARRVFVSPPLEEGRYVYNFEVRWQENGRPRDEKRQVSVHPGDRITVDFTRPRS
jgi:uncharacterized protein (TIGR03000 family)